MIGVFRLTHRLSRRRGSTLVHLQAAIAVAAIVIASVATSLATLYRLQTTTDELRERSSIAYRFEHRLRDDARKADAVLKNDDGSLLFQIEGADVQYAVDEDGNVHRTTEHSGTPSRDVMVLPFGVVAKLNYDEAAGSVQLTLEADKEKPGVGAVLHRRVRATIGRPHVDLRGDK